ncbi:MAG: tryptophan-rich sensory protein, partial [Nocardioides sp.]|nr:tryptophan-rich sensory protein [Nocardioides sp.]
AFPVVWTALYADLALVSATAVNEAERAGEADQAAAYWRALGANLLLNAGWSVLFWRLRSPALATLGAAALTASSADLARRAGSPGRARALVPYAAWCGFATVLSGEIARRNRSTR